jgi:biopolymer transport protein TolQ
MRIAAVMLTALLFALGSGQTAWAQLEQAAPTGGRAPIAAPAGEAAETAPLAAPTADVTATPVGPQMSEIEQTFTPIGLFLRADLVVKAVLLLLLLASFWSWVVIVDKAFAFTSLKRRTRQFEQNFWSGRSLDELFTQYSGRTDQPMAAVFVAALREWRRSLEKVANPKDAMQLSVRDRVEKAMNVAIQRETEKLERGLSFLATVGSTAPFVGLFGTVWGIMNSFQAIASRQDTTLAVVAPGIAEALFATALGLLAAIPAVIAYNRFVSELGRYSGRLEAFADEFSAFLSRQLDERGAR